MTCFSFSARSAPCLFRHWQSLALASIFAVSLAATASGQEPAAQAPAQPAATEPAPQAAPVATQDTAPPQESQPAQAAPVATAPAAMSSVSGFDLHITDTLTEDQLKQLLVGKDLFLRGGYLGDAISFNENGRLNGHAPFGSYTLCAVRIDKVRLDKHRLELEGARYGLHFLGALPYEDPTKAMDRVRITPKKKVLKLTIDRETVVKPKKEKEPKQPKGKTAKPGKGPAAGQGGRGHRFGV